LVTLLYVVTGYTVLLAVIVIVNLELIQQLLPTLRFDGYFIVSDWVGVPDLFRYIGPILKRTLFRQPADDQLQALKPGPQRAVTAWVVIVVPVLLAQLTFILLQLPAFIGIAWQRIMVMGSRTDILRLMADVAPTVFALLPLAGLTVLGVQAGRGVAQLIVNLGTKEPGGVAQTPQELQRRPTPGLAGTSRPLAMRSLAVVNAVVLVIAGGYLLSGRGSGSAPSARPSVPPAVAEAPLQSRPLTSAIVPLFEAVDTFPVVDRRHTLDSVRYAQAPPIGGDHDPAWTPCRFYDGPVRSENAVHSLEHGAIWVTYRPDLPADQVGLLARLARSRDHMLVSRWDDGLPAPVVVSSWGRQLKLASATDPRLVQFAEAFSHQSPEPNGAC
ncbi:MAG: DUF3105 domain-containing protein, partial [Actinobacteria bacterium]|nr:DUF3105 domain-containing protein [Actinomycetota bacterium]